MMKKLNWIWMVALMLAVTSLSLTSCSKEEGEETLPFTKENLVGKWKITNVVGDDAHHIEVGKVLVFNTDGSCTGWYSMETAYIIMKGSIHTYYGATNEPMFVYSLLTNKDNTLTVKMYGTLDDLRSCTMTWQKVVE